MFVEDLQISSQELDLEYDRVCNIIFGYPDTYGNIFIPESYISLAKDNNILTTAVVDLLSLTTLISPGELELDIAVGSSQRLGIPLWYGGPHPAFATNKKLPDIFPEESSENPEILTIKRFIC